MWNPTYDKIKQAQVDELTAEVLAKMKRQNDKSNDAKSKEVAKAEYALQKLQHKTFR